MWAIARHLLVPVPVNKVIVSELECLLATHREFMNERTYGIIMSAIWKVIHLCTLQV